jgi:hypothetical protein
MKVSQLKENIKNIVKKINEANALVTTRTGTKSVDFKNTVELGKLKADPNVSSIETTSGQKLKELDYKGITADITDDDTVDKNNMTKMSRADMLNVLRINPDTDGRNLSNGDLIRLLQKTSDMYSDLNEKDYIDQDDTNTVEDDFLDYSSIYELFANKKK